ncbi:MAG: sodium:panthothenate symporter [Deltaproteobacteria bacterium]|nr:MAG: sodium:panthothenate symporter [Deltaproteobacteria bacterium]
MNWIDWLIVILPVGFVVWIAFHSRKYIHGVVDYLAAGRVAGRYVLTVGDLTAGMGLITLVAGVEQARRSGFAVGFWGVGGGMIATLLALTGYLTYRFRQTKALSNGQFLEMRYSRKFRILASFIRILSEMLANSIGPAVSARFFIYFLGIPHNLSFWGMSVPTYPLLVGVVLIVALIVILPGGRIGLCITDAIQALFCYPVFILIVGYIIYAYSWGEHIVPVLVDRVPGENFLNPFDIFNLRDFNIVYLGIIYFGWFYNRGAWLGNDTSTAGRTPHEQKMAGVLGTWRNGFAGLMSLLIGMAVIVGMNHADFAPKAHEIRQEFSMQVATEISRSDAELESIKKNISAIPMLVHTIGVDEPMSQDTELDTAYLDAAKDGFGDTPEGTQLFKRFSSIYSQMMLPASFSRILPKGILGAFFLICILLMITTDDSRLFNASTAIVQDMVIPFKKNEMTPKQHIRLVKWVTVGVAVFFFIMAMLLVQLDYINMFLAILCAIWLGGAGPVMVFGLYSRFGNTVGAYCSLIFGCGFATIMIFLQRSWSTLVYPFLDNHNWVESIGWFLSKLSGPMNPYVVWEMDAVKFPINSMEIYFIAMVLGTIGYVAGSLLTFRKPYNLDRLLHRGKYNTDGVEEIQMKWTLKTVFVKLIGITPDYTRGDRIIAWSVFFYTFVYGFGLFLLIVIWNSFSNWTVSGWSLYYFIAYLIITPLIGVISTIWFTWGGVKDIMQLFRDLTKRIDNPLDDGRVEGHVSLVDVEKFGKDEDE